MFLAVRKICNINVTDIMSTKVVLSRTFMSYFERFCAFMDVSVLSLSMHHGIKMFINWNILKKSSFPNFCTSTDVYVLFAYSNSFSLISRTSFKNSFLFESQNSSWYMLLFMFIFRVTSQVFRKFYNVYRIEVDF